MWYEAYINRYFIKKHDESVLCYVKIIELTIELSLKYAVDSRLLTYKRIKFLNT